MTRLAVEFDWHPVGHVTIDAAGGLVFPVLSREPGLYRFWIESPNSRPGLYVGEASDLRRRMQHYRTPGPSQATNFRLNEQLKGALHGGAVVTVSVLTEAWLTLDDAPPAALDLARRNGRLIVEQTAIAAAAGENLADAAEAPIYPRLLDRPGVGEAEYE